MTMRLCNSRLPEEHFVCYQTSQCNWVIIKELYRCLQRYMLGWRISTLGRGLVVSSSNLLLPLRQGPSRRFDRRYPIPSSISLSTSLFTRSVILHLITNSLVTCLQGLGDEHCREGPEIPLRQSE